MLGKGMIDTERLRVQMPAWLPLAASVLALLLALLVGWRATALSSAEAIAARVEGARGQLVAQINALPQRPLQAFTRAASSSAVVSAAAAGDYAAAAAALKDAFEGATVAEVHPASLDEAYSGVGEVGFAKLALLNEALRRGSIDVAFAREGSAVAMDFAAPVLDAGTVVGVAYARRPPPELDQAVQALVPEGGYLAVMNGARVVAQAGDADLAAGAVRSEVPGVPLQVASAAPDSEPLLPGGELAHWLVAGLLLLVAAALAHLGLRRLRGRGLSSEGPEESLQDVMARTPAPAPEAPVARASVPATAAGALSVERSIFRAYDIRGVLGTTLDAGVARLIGQAIGTLMAERQLSEVVVARDGRDSGPALQEALMEGLRAAGIDVIDIGMVPTPVLYFATYHLNTGSGVMVTGSHNPPDYNGFKIVVGGETLSGEAIQKLYVRIAEQDLRGDGSGGLQHMRVDEDYLQRIATDVQLERRMKVVVDAGNGVAGGLGPQVLEAIGAEVVPLYCDIDGSFPNHHPDPSEPHNLRDLVTFVQKLDADLGVAFDGDGDRLGVVTRAGEIIYPDRLLMLFAQDVLMRNPGASIIYDVKCTGHLASHILRHGGSPIMWKTGHSLIKAKMRETEAELAGEMSGHFFFRERWFGFDDGLYAAARLLEILATDERTADEIFAELPKGVSTPELKVPMKEGEHYAFVERFRDRARFDGAKVATIDGVRADWPDGWGLVRASNTTPVLVLRFDADDSEALSRIQEAFRQQLLGVDAALDLPF